MRCIECGTAKGRYTDPRHPQFEGEECLCAGCFKAAAEERIEDLESEIEDLTEQLSQVGKRKKKLPNPNPQM